MNIEQELWAAFGPEKPVSAPQPVPAPKPTPSPQPDPAPQASGSGTIVFILIMAAIIAAVFILS